MRKKIFSHAVIILLTVILFGCAGQASLTSAKTVKDGTKLLYGKISRMQLFFDYPDWQVEYENYMPDPEILRKLQETDYDEIIVFLGTWCPDSQREIPRFFRILDQSGKYDKEKIKIWAVDRSKKLADNLTDTYDIFFVPTIIFFKRDRELGRIIEQPEISIEGDMQQILSGSE